MVIRAEERRLLGLRVPLAGELAIGRDETNGLVLDEPDVSRRHARVLAAEGGHAVRDLGSTNGTFVNGAEVEERVLESGDELRLGSAVLKYLAGGDLEALYHAEVRALALEDPLTGAFNRRHLLDVLAREMARCRRHGRELSLLLLDVDHFKRVNDAHGHLAGDEVLRAVAGAVSSQLRREDCLARYGGEELAVALPETGHAGARLLAEKVRRRVEEARVLFRGREVRVTASIGVAALAPEMERPEDLIAAADARLYEAKRAGRNRVGG